MAGEAPDSIATMPTQPETQGAAPGEQAAQISEDPNGRAAADWMRTAGPQTQGAAPGATAPQVEPQPPATVPVAVTSLKRGGLLGVIDSIGDALVGKTRPELGKDPDGNMYVKQHTLTHGEQWARIAGEAMVGAAAGLAAGKGAGNKGKAALAGIQAGQKIGQEDRNRVNEEEDQQQKIMLDNANNQMLRMKMAEETWRATRLKVEATQHDMDFAQKQEEQLTKSGATLLGTAAHPGDISDLQKINPDLAKDLVQNHSLEFVPHYDAQGNPAGFKVYKTPEGYRSTMLPKGAEFPTFNEVSGKYDWHQASDPISQGELDDYWTAAGAKAAKFKSDQAETALKQQQKETSAAEATKVPSEIQKNQAAATESNAKATEAPSAIAKNQAEADKQRMEAGEGPEGEALVDLIGKGQAPIKNLAYLASRNPALLAKVAAKYPDFDGGKIDSYVRAYQDFTSGKTAIALNAGATALGHMKELKALNTTLSHIPGTPAWNAYQNKVDTLATELAKFYGDATIPAIQHIKDTLGANLPGGRNAAIKTQAQSMSDKFNSYEQQWKNAAPSAAYEAQMPQMSEDAKEARAELDPKYRERLVKERQKQAERPAPAPAPATRPGEPVIETPLAPARPHAAGQYQFSVSAWKRANPNGDAAAAKQAAIAGGLEVVD